MNEVNRTLFIPLYGKAEVSKKHIILKDTKAEEIWEKEHFPIKGKARSKWLSYHMAMRARVFDDWTDDMLRQYKDALVLHIGCGLDSRFQRVKQAYTNWIDADFAEVIAKRQCYFEETENYHMQSLDASKAEMLETLPDATHVIVILEGISMYLNKAEIMALLAAIQVKYAQVHLLMDVYTIFAAKASKYKNPINEVGVTKVFGYDNVNELLCGTKLYVKQEHALVPQYLVNELKKSEQIVFKYLFSDKIMKKMYRLFELETQCH